MLNYPEITKSGTLIAKFFAEYFPQISYKRNWNNETTKINELFIRFNDRVFAHHVD